MNHTWRRVLALYLLALLSVTAGAWIRSEFYGDFLSRGVQDVCAWSVATHPGGFEFSRQIDWPQPGTLNLGGGVFTSSWNTSHFSNWNGDGDYPLLSSQLMVYTPPRYRFRGFGVEGDTWLGVFEGRVACPFWAAAVVHAGLPLLPRLRRSHRRRLAGHCVGCGYDLRASPGRCPECGAAAPVAQ